MASIYADHNASRDLTALLRGRGHDVVRTRDLGLDRATDGLQLLTAATFGRVFLTYNERDFVLLHDAWLRWSAAWQVAPTHVGIIILPQDQYWEPARAVDEIETVFRRQLGSALPSAIHNWLWMWRSLPGWVAFTFS